VLLSDRVEEAFVMFKLAHSASNESEGSAAVDEAFRLLHSQIVHEKHSNVKFRHLFTQPTLRKRTLIGFLTLFGGQAAGTQVINSRFSMTYLQITKANFSRLWTFAIRRSRIRNDGHSAYSIWVDHDRHLWQHHKFLCARQIWAPSSSW
jgi:hypothetical protein